MKREQIINKIKEVAARLFDAETEVYASGMTYPKCWLARVGEVEGRYKRPGERLTPDMRPSELLAYVQGMAAFNK